MRTAARVVQRPRRGRDQRRTDGFTLVEVLVALALTAVVVTAVCTVTASLSQAGHSQRAASRGEYRRQRLLEVVGRDLQGWTVNTNLVLPSPRPPAEGNTALLGFATTADSLAADATGSATIRRAVLHVRYVGRQAGDGWQMVRQEIQPGEPPLEWTLACLAQAPQVEVFDGRVWVQNYSSARRPQAVRLTLDGLAEVFLLQ